MTSSAAARIPAKSVFSTFLDDRPLVYSFESTVSASAPERQPADGQVRAPQHPRSAVLQIRSLSILMHHGHERLCSERHWQDTTRSSSPTTRGRLSRRGDRAHARTEEPRKFGGKDEAEDLRVLGGAASNSALLSPQHPRRLKVDEKRKRPPTGDSGNTAEINKIVGWLDENRQATGSTRSARGARGGAQQHHDEVLRRWWRSGGGAPAASPAMLGWLPWCRWCTPMTVGTVQEVD